MPPVQSESEACSACGYSLAGAALDRCPECGIDIAVARAGTGKTPWNRGAAALIPGAALVLLRPRRALSVARSPAAVRWRWAAVFAATSAILLILLWPVLRVGLMGVSIGVHETAARGLRFFTSSLPRFGSLAGWTRLWRWELISASRWWVFFGAITGALALRTAGPFARAALVKRFLLFAPWIAVLEIGYLAGVWVDEYNVVPEPSTIFITNWRWDAWLRGVWLTRGVLPSFAVLLVYLRAVARWGWPASLAAAAALTPVVINLSVFWSWLYLRIG